MATDKEILQKLLPFAAIAETIATRGRSPGTVSFQQQQILQNAEDRQRALEEEARMKALQERLIGLQEMGAKAKLAGLETKAARRKALLGRLPEFKEKGLVTDISQEELFKADPIGFLGKVEARKPKPFVPKTEEEKIEIFELAEKKAEIQAKANAEALFNKIKVERELKPKSSDTAKILSIARTLPEDIQKIQAALKQDFRGTLTGIITGKNRTLTRIANNAADKVGRLRSGGAINKEEEKRFMNNFASFMDVAFGEPDEIIAFLDGIIKEAQVTESAMLGTLNTIEERQGLTPQQQALEDLKIKAQQGDKNAIDALKSAGVQF